MNIEMILAVMRDHDLYRPHDDRGWPTCSCMTHYCECDHEGFLQAYELIASMSDPTAKV